MRYFAFGSQVTNRQRLKVMVTSTYTHTRWSWCRWEFDIQQAISKDIPEDPKEDEEAVDTDEDPEEELLVKPLLVVLQHDHSQCQAHCHPAQVGTETRVGAWRHGRGVKPQPHSAAELHTHCGTVKDITDV